MFNSVLSPKEWIALIVVIWLLMACAPASAQKRVALLIGNDNYQHERRLFNPVKDAELLSRVLREELKFDVVRVERNLDVAGMDRVIDAFARDARNASTIVFYFSGHGMTDPSDRRSYLLPVDAKIGAPGSPRIERQAMAAEDLRDRLKGAGGAITLMVLDACRDGPGLGKSGTKGLARVGGGNQLLVAYATEEGKTASDGNAGNSPYAKALAAAWRIAELSILQQLDLVYDEVTRQIPDQQPTREGNLRTDAFLLPSAAGQQLSRRPLDEDAWILCRDAKTPAPCQAYLARWSNGRFADLARLKAQDLSALSSPALAAVQPFVPPTASGELPKGRYVDKNNCLREADGKFVIGFRSDCR